MSPYLKNKATVGNHLLPLKEASSLLSHSGGAAASKKGVQNSNHSEGHIYSFTPSKGPHGQKVTVRDKTSHRLAANKAPVSFVYQSQTIGYITTAKRITTTTEHNSKQSIVH